MEVKNLEKSWRHRIGEEFHKEYMKALFDRLESAKREGKIIYPHEGDIFQAFNLTPFDQVKVVILGQDPYHGEDQAHGLAFSVKKKIKIPPSLVNIFQEVQSDVGGEVPTHGDLSAWAEQGVLLLNTSLTVEKGCAGSHQRWGWERFTDCVIEKLNNEKENLVFILWGKPAQKKLKMLSSDKHFILTAPHPSPLSVYRGFWGCQHFSKTNQYLRNSGKSPILW